MAPTVLLGLCIVIPAVLIVLLRSDAAVVLLSLCAGSVLVKFIGNETVIFVSQNSTKLNISGWSYVAILLIPAVLSIIALRKSVSSMKLPINLLTATAAGLLGVLLVVPLLPPSAQTQLTGNFFWDRLYQYQAAIISGSIAIALVSLWIGGHRGLRLRKKHH